MSTTSAPQFKVKLSCNHVVVLDETIEAGTPVECPRCTASAGLPRTRRAKKVTTIVPAPADERDAAEARIAELREELADATPEAVAAEQAAIATAIGSLALVPWGTLPTEAPAELDEYDPVLASAEYRAVKAWKDAGSVGDEPAAPNFAAMLAANAGGTQRRRKVGKKATTSKPRTSARRAAANKVQADIGFDGRKAAGVVKWSDAELATWIRTVVAEHPDTRKEDELEQVYWVERVAVSRTRFYRVWADATSTEAPAE